MAATPRARKTKPARPPAIATSTVVATSRTGVARRAIGKKAAATRPAAKKSAATQAAPEKPTAKSRADELAAELALINRIQQAMAAKLGFQAIVDVVGDMLRQMFGSDDLSIRWWDPEADTVVQLYSVEHGKHLPKGPPIKVRPTNKPLTRLLYEGIGSYLGTRDEQIAAGIGGASPGTDWCLSILGAPIRGARGVLGVIVRAFRALVLAVAPVTVLPPVQE